MTRAPGRPPRPTTVAAYIAAAPAAARPALRLMRQCIRQAAPTASEGLKWGMPAYSLDRILVTFALRKHHIGLYPTPAAVRAFRTQLAGYVTAAGSIQFPLDRPLPRALIRKIVAFRVLDAAERDAPWRS